jgi:hypothetical protein
MNRDSGLSVEEAKALADELTRLMVALEADLSFLVNSEYEALADALLPSGRKDPGSLD